MEKLSNLINKNPKYKSEKSDYLSLAVRDGKVVKGTGPHKVTLIDCQNATNRDYTTKKDVSGVNLIFEENGERKKYFVPTMGKDGKFHYLIEKFADIKEGTELILEYKRKDGDFKGFIDVKFAGEQEEGSKKVDSEEIPVVEEDGSGSSYEQNQDENFEGVIE